MEHDAAVGFWGDLAAGLEHSAIGALMRESLYLYPLANLLHIFGLILLVGAIGLLDLRCLGFGRALPLAQCSRYLTPLARAGFATMLASGFLLFAADAGPLVGSDVFRLKLLLIATALANALAFRLLWSRQLPDWQDRAPLVARLQAAVSLLLWCAAATTGRLIGYG